MYKKLIFQILNKCSNKIYFQILLVRLDNDFLISNYQLGNGSKDNPMRICFSSRLIFNEKIEIIKDIE